MKSFTKIRVLYLLLISVLFISACSGPQDTSRGDEVNLESETATSRMRNNTATGKLTVNSVTLDFFPNGEVAKDPKDEGRQFVKIYITIENTSEEDIFPLNFTSFHLNTKKEESVTETFLINDSNIDDHLKSTELEPGESVSGSLYFEVDGKETLKSMELVYEGYNEKVENVEGKVKFENVKE